jgi:phage terminase large subunit-like protein
VHREAQRMVAKSPALRKRLTTFRACINYPRLDSFFQPLGSDSDSTDGLNTHAVIGDELHAWRERHRGLFEKLTTAGGSRQQPLVLFITTAGDDKSDIWWEEREYATRTVESAITGEIVSDTLFAFVAAIDSTDRACHGCAKCAPGGVKPRRGRRSKIWTQERAIAVLGDRCDGSGTIKADDAFDEAVWPKANPNLGVSVTIDYLREAAIEAKQKPSSRNAFMRYHANVRVSSTEKAIDVALWSRCSTPLQSSPPAVSYGAWDLGRSDDFAAVALLTPIEPASASTDTSRQSTEIDTEEHDDTAGGRLAADDGVTHYDVRFWAWTCEARDQRLCTDQFQRWIDTGLLTVHQGDQVDFDAIQEQIVAINQQWQVRSWAFDPTFSAQMAQQLKSRDGLEIFPYTQAARFYNEPTRRFLRLLKQGRIHHAGNPLAAWMAGNLAIVRNRHDEWMPDKISSLGKIDGIVAAIMALSEALYQKGAASQSVYESRGVRTLG